MASANGDATLRKRQKIDSSKRTMFIAVAVVAFASGIALVVSFFLVKQIIFHSEVIGEKQSTIDTIRGNVAAADELKDNIRVLDANQALNSVKISDDSSALQVILDALPADANADALGASIQVRFVGAVGGVSVESLVVQPDVASEEDEFVELDEEGQQDNPNIRFSMSVKGSADALKELLTLFERSIRVIDLTSVEIQADTSGLIMSLEGRAYYEPAQTVELGTKVVKP